MIGLGPFEIETDSRKIARDSGYGDKQICDPGQEVCPINQLNFCLFFLTGAAWLLTLPLFLNAGWR